MWRGWRPVLFVLLAAAGCLFSSEPRGLSRRRGPPGQDDIFNERFVRSYGRVPTFEETFVWREELAQGIATYFVKHPDVAISPRSQHFRLHRPVALGMSKEEVMVLSRAPDAATSGSRDGRSTRGYRS